MKELCISSSPYAVSTVILSPCLSLSNNNINNMHGIYNKQYNEICIICINGNCEEK